MQSVGTDDQIDMARRRAIEGQAHEIASIVDCGDRIAEDRFDASVQRAVNQSRGASATRSTS
jgi:hypothetical protein